MNVADGAALVLDFCARQARLVGDFLAHHRPRDLETFRDVRPRRGTIQSGGVTWSYARHGAGVRFQHGELYIDAHTELARFPDGVDAWRLEMFLEARGIHRLRVGTQTFECDDASLSRLLEALAAAGVVRPVAPTLYVPQDSAPRSAP